MKARTAIKHMADGKVVIGAFKVHYRWTPENGFECSQFGENPWREVGLSNFKEYHGPFKLAPKEKKPESAAIPNPAQVRGGGR